MDVALEHTMEFLNRVEVIKFQSLFSWMLLLNMVGVGFTLMQSMVSILVLVDVALEHPRVGPALRCPSVSILVLVDVALELSGWRNAGYHPRSFNPCSRGCCS